MCTCLLWNGVQERHRVLQLVAKADGTAGLVVPAAGKVAAGDGLVEQPSVGQHVHRRVGRRHLHHAESGGPVALHRCEGGLRLRVSAGASFHCECVVAGAACAQPEHDLDRFVACQIDGELHCSAGIETRPKRSRETLPRHCGRMAQAAVTTEKFRAIGSDADRTGFNVRSVDGKKTRALIEFLVVVVGAMMQQAASPYSVTTCI